MLGLEMDPFPRELPPLAHHLLGMHHRLHFPHIAASRTPRRCLFGIADPATTRDALNRIIHEEAQRCVKTWEFDPIADRPVENAKRFSWEKIPAASQADPVKNCGAAASEYPGRTSVPRGAGPLAVKENLVAVPTIVEVSAPGRVADDVEDGLLGRVLPLSSEVVPGVPCSEVSDRSREPRRFAPYRQPRITEFWRQRKCSGEPKGMSAITSNAVGIADAEAQLAADGQ